VAVGTFCLVFKVVKPDEPPTIALGVAFVVAVAAIFAGADTKKLFR